MVSLSQEEREQRMKAILAKTKRLFLQDAFQRSLELKEAVAQWRQQPAGQNSDTNADTNSNAKLGDSLYRYAHTLKGVALTVGCYEVHALSEAADSYSIQHLDAWTEEAVTRMILLTERLFDGLSAEMQAEGLL